MPTTKKETNSTPDITTMNVYQKLLHVRTEFYQAGAKKSGKNAHAEFMYFELEDIVPIAEALFSKYHLLLVNRFYEPNVVACVVNTDKPEEVIDFPLPLVFISEPAKFRMNETQGAGATFTYYRRYLYMNILDLVESDSLDCQDGNLNRNQNATVKTPTAPAAPKKPVTADERKAIKEKLTSENEPASDADIAELKELMKKVIDCDPSQNDEMQEIVRSTDHFKSLTKKQYANVTKYLNAMISEYQTKDLDVRES